MTIDTQERFILRASCRDEIGIIADVATFLAARRLFILETANFGDPATDLFFMRLVFAPEAPGFTIAKFIAEFEPIAKKWSMTWEVRDARARPIGSAKRATTKPVPAGVGYWWLPAC